MPNDPWFTEAHVEKAGRAMADAELEDYMEDYRHYDKRARAALSAIPDPRAAGYAEGFAACRAMATDTLRGYAAKAKERDPAATIGHAMDAAADTIAALKPDPRAAVTVEGITGARDEIYAEGFAAAKLRAAKIVMDRNAQDINKPIRDVAPAIFAAIAALKPEPRP